MSQIAPREDIETFLQNLRGKMFGFEVVFRPRDKNLQSLAQLDIIPDERNEILKKLTAENYYRGPREDTYDSSKPEYYEFGYMLERQEVYIKISLGLKDKPIDCMSFHVAENPISYPYKKA